MLKRITVYWKRRLKVRRTDSSKVVLLLALVLTIAGCAGAAPKKQTLTPAVCTFDRQQALDDFIAGNFKWLVSEPLVAVGPHETDPRHAIKDPTVVRYNGRWHVFTTIRSKVHRPQIEHIAFDNWKDANAAERNQLNLTEKIPADRAPKDKYLCAPQVFYFEPHEKWYLIYQFKVKVFEGKGKLVPGYSTTDNIDDPTSWSTPMPLCPKFPEHMPTLGLDYWVICDDAKAHLFFTSLNGLLWHSSTKLEDFPSCGWTRPQIALRADIFEASHIYKVQGMDKYLAIIEANAPKRIRYQKAYLADTLDGPWEPLADTVDKPFAGLANIKHTTKSWTDSISHGEIIRAGRNQKLEVNPAELRYLFQGMSLSDRKSKGYGAITWRLGIIEPAK